MIKIVIKFESYESKRWRSTLVSSLLKCSKYLAVLQAVLITNWLVAAGDCPVGGDLQMRVKILSLNRGIKIQPCVMCWNSLCKQNPFPKQNIHLVSTFIVSHVFNILLLLLFLFCHCCCFSENASMFSKLSSRWQ